MHSKEKKLGHAPRSRDGHGHHHRHHHHEHGHRHHEKTTDHDHHHHHRRPPESPRPTVDAYWENLKRDGHGAYGVLEVNSEIVDDKDDTSILVQCMAWGFKDSEEADFVAQISNLILDKKAKESGEPSPLGNMLLKRLPVQFTLGGANSSRGGGKSTIYEIKEDHLSITNNQDWLNERITEFEENVLGPARSDRKRFLVKAWGPLLKPVLAKHEVGPIKGRPKLVAAIVDYALKVADAHAQNQPRPSLRQDLTALPPAHRGLWKSSFKELLQSAMLKEQEKNPHLFDEINNLFDMRIQLKAILARLTVTCQKELPREMLQLPEAVNVWPMGKTPDVITDVSIPIVGEKKKKHHHHHHHHGHRDHHGDHKKQSRKKSSSSHGRVRPSSFSSSSSPSEGKDKMDISLSESSGGRRANESESFSSSSSSGHGGYMSKD